MAVTLSCKLFADGIKFVNIHGWDLEGSGRLFETAVTRIQLGTVVGHIVLVNECFWNRNWRTLSINFIMIVFILAVQFVLNKKTVTKLNTVLRIIGKIDFQTPTSIDKSNWVYRYSHPYIRVLGPKQACVYMNEINSPVSVEPRAHTWYQEQRRYNVPLPLQSPLKKSLTKQATELLSLDDKKLEGMEKMHEKTKLNLDKNRELEMFSNKKEYEMDDGIYSPLQLSNRFKLAPAQAQENEIPKSAKLERPLKNQTEEADHEFFHFYSNNSHFRRDGFNLDRAISPDLHKLECPQLPEEHEEIKTQKENHPEHQSNKISMNTIPNEYSITSNRQKPRLNPLEFSCSQKGSKKALDQDRKPTIIEKKRSKPTPFLFNQGHQSKTDSKVSIEGLGGISSKRHEHMQEDIQENSVFHLALNNGTPSFDMDSIPNEDNPKGVESYGHLLSNPQTNLNLQVSGKTDQP